MKWIFLATLMLHGIVSFSQSATSADSSALQHAVLDALSKRKIADHAKVAANAASDTAAKYYKDWQTVAKTDSAAAAKGKLKYAAKQQDSLLDALAFAKADGAASVAETISRNLYRNAFAVYPVKNGHIIGGALMIGMASFFVLLLVWLMCKLYRFNLREALSENVRERQSKENSQYKELPEIIKNLTDPNSPGARQSEEKAAADKAAADDATKSRETAEAALSAAKVPFAANADDDQKTTWQNTLNAAQAAFEDARKKEAEARATADASAKAAASVLSPALLANLATLFPPTLELSASNPDTAGHAAYRPSVSRLIAFISAMLLFTVGLACSCFFLYFYLVNGAAPDLSNLSAVLIALGIGMAPYAINKVANASADKNKTI